MKAIVLSGGGGKGAYQVGVWKALRKIKYNYEIITGTSIGAINGLLMVQNDFYKAYLLWNKVNFKMLYDMDLDSNNLYVEYAKNFFKTGGIKTDTMDNLLKKVFDKKKFLSSKVKYGIVTYNVSKLKPEIKTKEDLKKSDSYKYILASATCFPAFKMININGDKYIDGGYYDYCPINLAIDLGATEIIAVDLEAVGIRKKVTDKNVTIIYIRPKNQISSFLDFDNNKTKRDLKYGYNDTLKTFKLLDGNRYTFKKNNLDKNYNKIITKFYNENTKIMNCNKKINYNMMKINKILFENDEKKIKSLINNTIEFLAQTYQLDDTKIYNIDKLNKKIYEINENIKIGSINRTINIKSNKIKIKYIYNLFKENKHAEISKIMRFWFKEYLGALYLYILKKEV